MQSWQAPAPADPIDVSDGPPWPNSSKPNGSVASMPVSVFRRVGGEFRKPVMLVNIVLAVLIAAGGFWAYRTVWGSRPAAAATNAAAGQRVPVATRTVTQTVSAAGTVASSDIVTASFTTSGTVTAIYVKLGQAVKKGQTLARIDPTAADEQLKTAQDNLTAAQESLDRARAASDTTSIDSAQLQVDSAQDAVTSAQAAVNGTVLTAPITGTVIAQNGTVGASSGSTGSGSGGSGSGGSGGSGGGAAGSGGSGSSASSGGFIQIADLTKMEVDGDFAEADATKLATGMTAEVTWNALTGATATATVASIDPTATTSNNVVNYGVVVGLTSLPKGIRIGQSTNVVVTTATKDDVLAVPSAAVTGTGANATVNLYADGTTRRQRVGVGLVGDAYTEITSGLQAGDLVVLPVVTSNGTTNPFGGGGLFGGGGGFGGRGGGGGGAGRGGTGAGGGG